jgi:DNA-binding response OmpR family regulator
LLQQSSKEAFNLVRKIRWILQDQIVHSSQRVFKDIVIDAKRMQVSIAGASELQQLSAKELRILLFFVDQPRRCIDREKIRSGVWDGLALSPRTIDTHISRLRKKLSASTVELKSVYGGGYTLE